MTGFPGGRLFMILVALLALVPAADAADAPAALQAEAARGVAAAGRCDNKVWSTEDYASCIDDLVGVARTEDEAATPFQLGVYCTAFHTTARAYRDWSRKSGGGAPAHADGDLLRETTLDQYDSCVFQAQRAKLAVPQICTVTGLNCAELNPMLDHWKAVTRADE